VIEDFYGLNELEFDQDEEIAQDKDTAREAPAEKFDLALAVNALRAENVQDLACIHIPKEVNYADHMIIGTCVSERHLSAAFVSLNRKFKSLKDTSEHVTDQFLRRKIGAESKWAAVDLGTIVVHLFLPEHREFYDLESLWTCGSELDDKVVEFHEQRRRMEDKLAFLEVTEHDQNKKL
jgi:ribosome silencing factor RsfS/YbeB/iojap